MNSLKKGFTSLGILLLIAGGIILVSSVVGGTLYIAKPSLFVGTPAGTGKCGDGVCGVIEKKENICPQDCTSPGQTTEEGKPASSGGTANAYTESFFDLTYSSEDSEAVKLDLYMPDKICSGKSPVIVMIHGGAFRGGDKKPVRTDFLTKECYAVASINYRLSGEALFPAGNQDVKSAVRWLRANADTYDLDADNFGAMGGSAGGYFASFLGTTSDIRDFDVGDNLEYSSAVQAVVDEFGPVDFSTLAQNRADAGLRADSAESNYLGCDISSSACSNVAIASPSHYVSKGDAPFLILHGTKDSTIPIKQSQDFYKLLLKTQVRATFISVPNAGHGGNEFANYESQIVEFFNKYLKKI